jgi:hypothetical protein
MKKTQFSQLFTIIAAAILFCQNIQATTFLTEQFNYGATGNLGANTALGSTGGSPGWNSSTFAITLTNGTGSLDGTGLGLVLSAGDDVNIAATNLASATPPFLPNGCYNLFVAKPASGPTSFPPNVTTNLYTSFLYRFNVGTDVANASMIACMELQSGGIQSASGADAYWQLFARTNGGNIQLGIAKNVFNNSSLIPATIYNSTTNWSTVNLSAGQTFFVVVRLQINATNGVSSVTNGVDVIADLFINPSPSLFGASEANVPTPNATSPVGDGTVPTSSTGPGRFFIVSSGPNANLDELRIASSWAEVTPPLGQCISAGISLSPTNVTQSAEISAILRSGATGTAATNQWQISQNGGATWANIPGAIFPTYITPNLTLASDNGNQYRMVVGVPCDGSSATSTVATVTLTAPVVTPVGVVMDDFFSDTLRGNAPVTPNNSVWVTSDTSPSSSQDLNADDGSLTAIPISGTSSLYVGGFVDETTTNLPVDLAVGTTIKVTFPFIPVSFNSHTNNGALRFGLFDYADGSTLPIADSSAFTGSLGQGINVRGYMLSVDFGTNFTTSSPLSLLVRNGLSDNNLMGTTGDYLSMNSGPSGGGFSNAPAFMAGTTYTLAFSVTRTAINTCSVTAAITGGGTNWTFTSTDTNGLAYHRFDAFAMRPNTLETSADTFSIPEFKVEVLAATLSPTSITITNVSRSGNNVTLGWNPTPPGTYTYSVLSKTNLTDATWFTNQTGISTTSYIDTSATANTRFYRLSSP